MKILAFETSCDETAVAIVQSGRFVIADNIISQNNIHSVYGGVVPELASRNHLNNIYYLTEKTLHEANLSYNDIKAIAVTCAPGLIGSLIVGVNFAKSLAYYLNIPFIPIHHLKGHIAANYISNKNLVPPFLCLVISGGHTLIIKVNSYISMDIIGRTHDDAVGEVFDKIARKLGLGYPGGPIIDKLTNNNCNLTYDLPHPSIKNSKLDFSFSGLKTSIISLIDKYDKSLNKAALCSSFTKKVCEILISRVLEASKQFGINKIAICGGVAANSMIRNEFIKLKLVNKDIYIPEIELCTDNASMIASQAYYEYLSNNFNQNKTSQNAYSTLSINNLF